jgi:CHAT domain-containing protein
MRTLITINFIFFSAFTTVVTAQKWQELNNRATEYFNSSQFHLSLEYQHKALERAKIEFGTNSKEYAQTLLELGMILHQLHDFDSAERCYSSAIETYQTIENDFGVAKTLIYLGGLYNELNIQEKAEKCYIKSKRMFEKHKDTSSDVYYTLLNSMANLYAETDRQKESLNYYFEIERNIDKINVRHHSSFYNNIGMIYNDMGIFSDAEKYFKKAIEIGKKYNVDYSQALNNLALLYGNQDNSRDKEVISLFEESLNLTKKFYNIDVSKNISFCICDNLAFVYERAGNYPKAKQLILEGNNLLKNKIMHYFSFLSEKEKELNLENFIRKVDMFQSFYCRNAQKHPELAGYAYNNALMTKELMLGYTQNLRKAILSSENTEKIAILDELDELSSRSLKLIALPPNSAIQSKIQEIQNEINTLQKQLARDFKQSGNFEEYWDKDWTTVKKNLKQGEAAIEFVYFEEFSTEYMDWSDDYQYYAILIKPELECPLLISLANENKLYKAQSIFNNLINNTRGSEPPLTNITDLKELYNLIWKPINNYLKPNEKIFFSTSGYLHQIPFSALIDENGKYLYEKYSLHQQSSTREIIDKGKTQGIHSKHITIFGDIDYNATINELLDDAKKYIYSNPVYLYNDKYDILGKWEKLVATKTELDGISETLSKKGYRVDVLRNFNASEDAFYSLKNNEILHFATHGYYKRISDDKSARLFNSGLVLAGANTGIFQKKKAGINDGFLTAYEIALSDLSNTKLVVLSACYTGLGYTDWDESVWGLERAFKIAGAHSMILTLWAIDDIATSDFMGKFYEEWLSGKSRHEAFKSAQTYIRQYQNKKYDDPYYWAAFKMLD